MAQNTGPFLLAAVLCEAIIEGKDGRLSLINVVEQMTATASGAEPPDEMPTVPVELRAVVAMKAGSARGRYAIRVQPQEPSGQFLEAAEIPVQFKGDDSGIRAIFNLRLGLRQEGVHWFDVTLVRGRGEAKADELLTRIPLSVVYRPQKVLPGGPGT